MLKASWMVLDRGQPKMPFGDLPIGPPRQPAEGANARVLANGALQRVVVPLTGDTVAYHSCHTNPGIEFTEAAQDRGNRCGNRRGVNHQDDGNR